MKFILVSTFYILMPFLFIVIFYGKIILEALIVLTKLFVNFLSPAINQIEIKCKHRVYKHQLTIQYMRATMRTSERTKITSSRQWPNRLKPWTWLRIM